MISWPRNSTFAYSRLSSLRSQIITLSVQLKFTIITDCNSYFVNGKFQRSLVTDRTHAASISRSMLNNCWPKLMPVSAFNSSNVHEIADRTCGSCTRLMHHKFPFSRYLKRLKRFYHSMKPPRHSIKFFLNDSNASSSVSPKVCDYFSLITVLTTVNTNVPRNSLKPLASIFNLVYTLYNFAALCWV